uniref:LIM/homeobox protein Lhx9 n=1 Tax=Nothobranchius furzeri TaxID=105023 RepID=A0A8C6M687_NOTFU
MMSPDDQVLEDLLYGSDLGDKSDGVQEAVEEAATVQTAVSIQEPIICAGCGEQVCDRFFLLAAGRVWHNVCLCCSQCQCELQTHPSLYWRDGNIYCQQDYCRSKPFSALFCQCARCFQPIPPTAMVMRSGDLAFHPHCFSCQVGFKKNFVLFFLQQFSHKCMDFLLFTCRNVIPRKRQQPAVSGEGEESGSGPETRLDEAGRTRRRTKRIRTCFRSEQLRALESYFAQKHNPDGKDWTCLAHKTGLPKRVLQVWFQNARAKLRRSLNSEDSQANSPSGAVAMATTSSVTTCSPSNQSDHFPASTIDQLQLSLLTAPLSEPSSCPVVDQSSYQLLQSPSLFPDYYSQSAPGCIASLEAQGDFGEAEGGAERDIDTFRPHHS